MKPLIWGASLDNTRKASLKASQPARTAFAQLVVKNLDSPAALLAAVKAAHKPTSKPKTTAENRRRLESLTRGLVPPSKPRHTVTYNRF